MVAVRRAAIPAVMVAVAGKAAAASPCPQIIQRHQKIAKLMGTSIYMSYEILNIACSFRLTSRKLFKSKSTRVFAQESTYNKHLFHNIMCPSDKPGESCNIKEPLPVRS